MKISQIGKIATIFILIVWAFVYLLKPSHLEFSVRGRVAGFGSTNETLIIEHEKIPGFMDAMTMPFTVKHPNQLKHLNIGDAIKFIYYVKLDDFSSHIYEIEKINDSLIAPLGKIATESHSFMNNLVSSENHFIQNGDSLPNIKFYDQFGESFQLDEWRGNDLFLTFIYTNCPVPDYCPLMSFHFKELHEKTKGKNSIRFISISFDPNRDNPNTLKKYGNKYTQDFSRWKFVSGSENEIKKLTQVFSVITQFDNEQIIHNLRTIHIDKNGIVRKIWPDNKWTVDEVMEYITNNTDQ